MSAKRTPVDGDDSDDLNVFTFFDKFPDEQAAIRYLEAERWPDRVECPRCDHHITRPVKNRNTHYCAGCKKQFSVRTGSIFEYSNIPLRKWIYAMYVFNNARKGISSAQLGRELGITQSSAWFMMHRLREAMQPDYELLRGEIQIDEAWIGGLERNKHYDKKLSYNWAQGKQVMLGLREKDGRIIIRPIRSNTREDLEADILFAVEKGAFIFTDEHRGYEHLSTHYEHETVRHKRGEWVRDSVTTNSIESVWAILKRAHKGIYHQWSKKHGGRYGNEVAFRLTEGDMSVPIVTRVRRLTQRSFEVQLTYKELVR